MVALWRTLLSGTVGAVASQVLATFDGNPATTLPFSPVNDPVMGGQSKSNFTIVNDTGVFQGEVAVVPFLGEPGFCILQAPGLGKSVSFPDLTATQAFKVEGMLKEGLTNWEVTLTTSALQPFGPGTLWKADFTASPQQSAYTVSVSDFVCNQRGKLLDSCGSLASQLDSILSIGVGTSGVAGHFRFELAQLTAVGELPGEVVLASFGGAEDTTRAWRQTNDPVMGGASSGTFTVHDGAGVMNGTVAIIPKLGVPGFIKAATVDRRRFPDVSSCKGLMLTVKSSPASYPGYRVSFGMDSAYLTCHKVFARGFKANFIAPDDFGVVRIPFDEFTSCWDDATGDAMVSCHEDSQYCPSASRLSDLQTLALWAEGVEGDVTLTIQAIGAYGCGLGQSRSEPLLWIAALSLSLLVTVLGFFVSFRRKRSQSSAPELGQSLQPLSV